MALVLCTGIDPAVMQTRKLILEQAGHTVVLATNEPDIIGACGKHAFHVAVIGQTISRRMKQKVVSLIRENCPSAKILELYPMHQGRAIEDADSWLQVPADVPDELAERVGELARKAHGRAKA
jgi:CheY-like chemotaxis protein